MYEETVVEFRNRTVIPCLKGVFGENNVKKEWDVAKNATDDLTRNLYCPRIDIAVGPFNIDRRVEENKRMINQTFNEFREMVTLFNLRSSRRFDDSYLNQNPRCFLAIEIENTGTRKTRLGSIVNASAIGKIGIIVAWNRESLIELVRIEDYLEFIRNVGKIPEAFKNVMMIGKDRKNFINL